MSYKLAAAVAASGLPRREKAIAQVLAGYANDAGQRAWPSVARLAIEAGYSERSVRRALDQLVEAGVIAITRAHGRHRSREYRIAVQCLPSASAYAQRN